MVGYIIKKVKNVFKKNIMLNYLLFVIKKITIHVNINDLKDKSKWIEGWVKIIEK